MNARLRIVEFALMPLGVALALVLYGWVFYWKETGDLRLYLWTQIVPLLAVPACIWLFRSRFTHRDWYWAVFASYVLAKAAELGDAPIFALSHRAISGHTLKHLLAALGLAFIVLMVTQRRAEDVR